MGNLYNTIASLCEKNNIKGAKMCDDIGISKGLLTDLKMGRRTGVSAVTAQKIASYFGVSVGYLLGEEDDNSQKEKTHNRESCAVVLNDVKMYAVPLYEAVSAGFGAYASDEVIDYMPCILSSDEEARNTICLKVWGDSMSPKIESGDVIQVTKQTSVDSGSLAVVLLDGEEGLVKRVVYGKSWVELQSINPIYPTQRFENDSLSRIRVVGLVKKIIKEV